MPYLKMVGPVSEKFHPLFFLQTFCKKDRDDDFPLEHVFWKNHKFGVRSLYEMVLDKWKILFEIWSKLEEEGQGEYWVANIDSLLLLTASEIMNPHW